MLGRIFKSQAAKAETFFEIDAGLNGICDELCHAAHNLLAAQLPQGCSLERQPLTEAIAAYTQHGQPAVDGNGIIAVTRQHWQLQQQLISAAQRSFEQVFDYMVSGAAQQQKADVFPVFAPLQDLLRDERLSEIQQAARIAQHENSQYSPRSLPARAVRHG